MAGKVGEQQAADVTIRPVSSDSLLGEQDTVLPSPDLESSSSKNKNGDYVAVNSQSRPASPTTSYKDRDISTPSPTHMPFSEKKGAYMAVNAHPRTDSPTVSFQDPSTTTLSLNHMVDMEKTGGARVGVGAGEESPTSSQEQIYKRGSTNPIRNSTRSARREKALALALKKQRRKRLYKIWGGVIAAVVVIALAVGLSLKFTIGRRSSSSASSSVYVAPIVNHTTPENDLMIQMFEWYIPKNSTHWTRVADQLPNLKILGVKNIWLPPASKNANRAQIGYDVYDLWDLGEFNAKGNVSTNMGSKAQLQLLSQKAAAADMGLIADAVFNQRTGADATVKCQAHTINATDHLQSTSESMSIEAWVQFNYPARNGKYSTKKWSCDDFTATDYDQTTQKSAIYKIEAADNDFETDVSKENGNYDYLMLADVAFKNPSVRADVLSWVTWFHDQVNLAGFRLDAGKHLSTGFIVEMLDAVKAQNNGTDKFFAVEYFTAYVDEMVAYHNAIQGRGKLFDTALLTNFNNYYLGTSTDIRQIFNATFLASNPNDSVTIVVTHDTQPGQSLDQLYVGGWFQPLAYAFTLLRQEGLPCLFYGDIYGTYDSSVYTFTLGTNRRVITDMAVARKFWAYGTQTDYFNDPSTIGWTRTGVPGDRPDGLAVVVSIADTATKLSMNVGSQHAGETWADLTQNIIGQTVTIDSEGNGAFPVRGQSVSVYVNVKAKEGIPSLGQFDGDIYNLYPYNIGHATNNYQSGGTLGGN